MVLPRSSGAVGYSLIPSSVVPGLKSNGPQGERLVGWGWGGVHTRQKPSAVGEFPRK